MVAARLIIPLENPLTLEHLNRAAYGVATYRKKHPACQAGRDHWKFSSRRWSRCGDSPHLGEHVVLFPSAVRWPEAGKIRRPEPVDAALDRARRVEVLALVEIKGIAGVARVLIARSMTAGTIGGISRDASLKSHEPPHHPDEFNVLSVDPPDPLAGFARRLSVFGYLVRRYFCTADLVPSLKVTCTFANWEFPGTVR